eukprot:768052-Hanusia_phi.AAC.2
MEPKGEGVRGGEQACGKMVRSQPSTMAAGAESGSYQSMMKDLPVYALASCQTSISRFHCVLMCALITEILSRQKAKVLSRTKALKLASSPINNLISVDKEVTNFS